MSDHITAGLDTRDFDRLLYHTGSSEGVLRQWRQLLQDAWARGWEGVKEHAPNIMTLIADPRMLHSAAVSLRSGGPKAPGPNRLRLESLNGDEMWGMCSVLGKAITATTYRPGQERTVWVPKASGLGNRPIVLSDVQDRVVQKAMEMALRPVCDPLFDPLSFGNRPGRSREQAIAVAEQLATDYPVWLTHDLKDAFCRIPVPRLLDVVFKLLPCPRLRAFLEMVLPPQSRKLTGVKQGGPLSAWALEVYLTHFLHMPWRKAGHDVHVIRYADDLLLAARDTSAAKAADAALRELLIPAGMLLKHSFEGACHDIGNTPAEWLGYQLQLDGKQFRVRLSDSAFKRLGRRFLLAHSKCRPAERANHVLKGWVVQLGPCDESVKPKVVCEQAVAVAREYGFKETPPVRELKAEAKEAARRWKAIRKGVRRTSGYLATGVLAVPTPTSVVW